jgi:D-alanyl-D-alanine carboxypeptidase (penicillin-binding protein 5/6)
MFPRLAALGAATAMAVSLLAAPAVAAAQAPPAATPAPPEVPAAAWLVADLDTGEVLAAHAEHERLAPASTLKLLTALALAPGLDRDRTVTAVHEDAAIDGSKVGLVPGSVYRVDDLLHGLLLASGNDAAHALAGLAGGMDVATARMQQVAEDLGARDTVVRNTSGLDADGQVSSVYDLALIGRAVLADPELADLVAARRYAFPGKGTTFDGQRPTFEVANHNRLLAGYEGTLGLKNGYTVAARGSFVGAVERDGHRYLVSLLKVEGRVWEPARALLDWAVAHGPAVTPVGQLPPAAAQAQPVSTPVTAPPGPAQLEQDEPTAALAAAVPPALDDAGRHAELAGWLSTLLITVAALATMVLLLRTRVLLLRRHRQRQRPRA